MNEDIIHDNAELYERKVVFELNRITRMPIHIILAQLPDVYVILAKSFLCLSNIGGIPIEGSLFDFIWDVAENVGYSNIKSFNFDIPKEVIDEFVFIQDALTYDIPALSPHIDKDHPYNALVRITLLQRIDELRKEYHIMLSDEALIEAYL